jgi:hypothetical protein
MSTNEFILNVVYHCSEFDRHKCGYLHSLIIQIGEITLPKCSLGMEFFWLNCRCTLHCLLVTYRRHCMMGMCLAQDSQNLSIHFYASLFISVIEMVLVNISFGQMMPTNKLKINLSASF